MIFKDENNLSFYPKCLFMTAISLITLLAGHLMFNDAHDLASWLKSHAINGDFSRQVILMFCLYLLGSWLNTYSEYTRYVWKNQKGNKGYLYTQGLFKYSMHINYFGDIVLFTGIALLTLNFSMLFIPFVMAMNFIFFIIPRLDKYLSAKYSKEFEEYTGRTKKFIPGIY